MIVNLVVPEVGESIHEVQVMGWKKQPGDWVEKDEELLEIESEKATVPVSAPAAGRLQEVLKKDGEFAEVGDTLARIEASDGPVPAEAAEAKVKPTPQPKREPQQRKPPKQASDGNHAQSPRAAQRAAPKQEAPPPKRKEKPEPPDEEQVEKQVEEQTSRKEPSPRAEQHPAKEADSGDRSERRVPMNMLRQTIARRLVEAQKSAALVTTFNEVDMQEVMDLRRDFGEMFKTAFDVKLGFMSFFVKAVVEGLKRCPEINAQIDGKEIVYRGYYDIGVAIGSGRGLVVPVLRSCERLSFAQIEHQIADFAARAGEGRLAPEELAGGTFTISNGGIYGSLLSTPIVNPPQSGVLGLHAIQDRPVARNGQVVIRPMMYVALTYDHRLVDGREAVTFLRRIKDVIETPARLFLEI